MPDDVPEPTLTASYSHALTLSWVWHRTQTRKGRDTPYLAHLMSVSALVLEAGGDEALGIAALLHDALEDAPDQAGAEARREVIRQEFGARVLAAVEGCTDGTPGQRKRMSWAARKKGYLAHLRGDGGRDPVADDALAVSLCDKLHNARAILRDLRREGDALWERFTGGKAGSLWYYAALEEAYRSRLDGPGSAGRAAGREPGHGGADPDGHGSAARDAAGSRIDLRDHLAELRRTVDAILREAGVERSALEAPDDG